MPPRRPIQLHELGPYERTNLHTLRLQPQSADGHFMRCIYERNGGNQIILLPLGMYRQFAAKRGLPLMSPVNAQDIVRRYPALLEKPDDKVPAEMVFPIASDSRPEKGVIDAQPQKAEPRSQTKSPKTVRDLMHFYDERVWPEITCTVLRNGNGFFKITRVTGNGKPLQVSLDLGTYTSMGRPKVFTLEEFAQRYE